MSDTIFMTLLFVLAGITALFVLGAACATNFDTLKARAEYLSDALYLRASYKDPFLNLVPRGTWETGTGWTKTNFEIGRSEMSSEEESWTAIQSVGAVPNGPNTSGACDLSYQPIYVGFHERNYAPEKFGLVGPLICQDDLTMYYKAGTFWQKFFQSMEMRSRKSVIGRIGNAYMYFVPKASANANFAYIDGGSAASVPTAPDMTGLQGGNIPTSNLTQQFLDETALILDQEGVSEGNSNGWITLSEAGHVYTLYIGTGASNQIALNNPEFRQDLNASYMGLKDANPVIQRINATRVIKNFRHVINLFPPRWTTQQVDTTNSQGNGQGYVYGADDGVLKRVPIWQNVGAAGASGVTDYINSAIATKGVVPRVNPSWSDPAKAPFEACLVLNPMVMTEEILQPVNSAPGMKWNPQNYFGEWTFVIGNDALLGINSCAGISDPLKTRGRHFGQYRHAFRPEFPTFGRLILFKRCPAAYDTMLCS